MKKTLLALFLLPLAVLAGDSPNMGIGFRFGDISGFTFKKYDGTNAYEISLGRSYYWGGDNWYNESFNSWYKKKNYNYPYYIYRGYSRTFPLALQMHYLFHRPVKTKKEDKNGAFEWYYGLGAQIRWQTITYFYDYQVPNDPRIYSGKDRYTALDLGVDGVIGIEYTMTNAPLSFFADGTGFMEILDDPFRFWPQLGLGIRYNL